MSNSNNAAPMIRLLGIKDASGGVNVREPEQTPTHLPHLYIFAETGPTEPHLVGSTFTQLYGLKTADPRYGYYNHQTALLERVLGAGNSVFVQRLKPADAGPNARLLLSLDIVPEVVQQYQRDASGKFILNEQGNRIPVEGSGATVSGHRARWVLNDYVVGGTAEPFGAVSTKAGAITSSTSVQSRSYPILEVEASFFGAAGNNLGLRLSAPSTDSTNPVNDSLAGALGAHLFRISALKRLNADSSANVVETMQGEQSVDFCLKPGAIDLSTDTEYSLQDIFIDAYQDLDTPGMNKIYGPFGKLKVYENNVKAVLAMIGAAEAPSGLLPTLTMDENSEHLYSVNPFTGTDLYGTPYYTLKLDTPAEGGLVFGESTNLWASGGSDGTMTFESHDLLVRNELANYGETEADMLNWARFPVSCYYDSGFSMDTKLAMLTPLGKRKDLWVVLSTQDVSKPLNTPAEDSSIAITLKNAARLYPESEVHGTKVCRAVVVGHAGTLIGSKYRGHLPYTLEFAEKCANYMGAGSGVWASNFSMTMPPNNHINLFKAGNVSFKSANARSRDWANGLIYAESYDMRSDMWPALQTVYDDDTSILNSFINMTVAVDLQKVAQRVWADMTGIDELDEGEIILRSNELIMKAVAGKYDGRVEIRPDTHFTAGDRNRGYSWSADIHMYGDNMISVGTTTVVAHRSSELAGS